MKQGDNACLEGLPIEQQNKKMPKLGLSVYMVSWVQVEEKDVLAAMAMLAWSYAEYERGLFHGSCLVHPGLCFNFCMEGLPTWKQGTWCGEECER
jgi:hypothetical protein